LETVMKRRRILSEIHETAAAMHRSGTLDEKTMREFDALTFPPVSEATWRQMAKKLTVAIQNPDPAIFLRALGAVLESIGVERTAQRLGLKAARLAGIIGPKARPSFEAVRAVVTGLGFRFGFASRAIAQTAKKRPPSGTAWRKRPRRRTSVHPGASAGQSVSRKRGE
jgi:DNA-binding phage protein